jgi:hypothetical protein
MQLKINGIVVPKVINYAVTRITRNTNIEYNANGGMLIDLVNRKHKLTVYLGDLSGEELQGFAPALSEVFFEAEFYSPYTEEGLITADFHMTEQPAQIDYVLDDVVYYKALKLEMEER